MRISIGTYAEHGDVRHLLYVDWPALPPIGATVALTGPMFGDDLDNTTHFEVVEIVFAAECRGNEVVSEDPAIMVALPRHCASFVPYCTCKPEDREPDAGRAAYCANCGDRYPSARRLGGVR